MKKAFSRFATRSRLYQLALLSALFLTINLGTRIVLQVSFPQMLPFSGEMPPGLAKGLLNDAGTLFFVLLLPAALLLLPKDSFMRKKAGTIYLAGVFFLFSLVFIFNAFAEFFFWDEFASRFNFIAVDYLIYTTEVARNIVESYPLFRILAAVTLLALAVTWIMLKISGRILKRSAWLTACSQNNKTFGRRLALLGGLYLGGGSDFRLFCPSAGQPKSLLERIRQERGL